MIGAMAVPGMTTQVDIRRWMNTAIGDAGTADVLVLESEWALSPEVIHFLTSLIRERRPRSILEFGAGRSSVAMSRAMADIGGGRLTSIDHAPEYCVEAWNEVKSIANVDAELVVGSIESRVGREGRLHTYRDVAGAIQKRGPYDLVVIDAPPGGYGRDAPLHLAWPHLSDGAVVILDDYCRDREQAAVRRWMSLYSGLKPLCLETGFGRGVAILQRVNGVRRSFPVGAFLSTLLDPWRYRRGRWQRVHAGYAAARLAVLWNWLHTNQPAVDEKRRQQIQWRLVDQALQELARCKWKRDWSRYWPLRRSLRALLGPTSKELLLTDRIYPSLLYPIKDATDRFLKSRAFKRRGGGATR